MRVDQRICIVGGEQPFSTDDTEEVKHNIVDNQHNIVDNQRYYIPVIILITIIVLLIIIFQLFSKYQVPVKQTAPRLEFAIVD